jgi:hypothetical protein
MFRKLGLAVMAAIVALLSARFGMARDNGQFAQADPQIRQWFRNQVSPRTGVHCCSEADGEYAEEDIRDGHYWTRFSQSNGEWMQVPDDVVIKDPNRNGAPVVWWYADIDHGKRIVKIRCYAVGSKV